MRVNGGIFSIRDTKNAVCELGSRILLAPRSSGEHWCRGPPSFLICYEN